jgi:hypothetical protein
MSKQAPLQRRIILHLAQNQPQTKNEIAKGIKSDYKSSWIALRKLGKKGLIKTAKTKPYKGNLYPCFWLTELGISLALYEGANPELLLKQTLKTYSENKVMQFLIEAVPIFGEGIASTLGEDILDKDAEGKLVSMLSAELLPTFSPASQVRREFDFEQLKRFKALLKKYPELYQRLTVELRQIADNLKTLSNLLENSE